MGVGGRWYDLEPILSRAGRCTAALPLAPASH